MSGQKLPMKLLQFGDIHNDSVGIGPKALDQRPESRLNGHWTAHWLMKINLITFMESRFQNRKLKESRTERCIYALEVEVIRLLLLDL
jgi:hypothetical protein